MKRLYTSPLAKKQVSSVEVSSYSLVLMRNEDGTINQKRSYFQIMLTEKDAEDKQIDFGTSVAINVADLPGPFKTRLKDINGIILQYLAANHFAPGTDVNDF